MARSRFVPLLRQFVLQFHKVMAPGPSGLDLGALWRARRTFREKWDPERPDFGAMLREATAPLAGLTAISGDYLQAIAARPFNDEPLRRFTEELFRDPQAEPDTWLDIIRRFSARRVSLLGGTSHFRDLPRQDLEYALALLALRFPDRAWFYSEGATRRFLTFLDTGSTVGIGMEFSLEDYSRLCQEILDLLRQYPAVLALTDPIRESLLGGVEDGGRCLVSALLLSADTLCLYEQAGLSPLPEDYLRLKEQLHSQERSLRLQEEKYRHAVRDYVLPDLTGSRVSHRDLGEGLVTDFRDNRFQVRFPSGARTFGWEDILLTGDITIRIPSFQSPMLMGYQAHRMELEDRRARLEEMRRRLETMAPD